MPNEFGTSIEHSDSHDDQLPDRKQQDGLGFTTVTVNRWVFASAYLGRRPEKKVILEFWGFDRANLDEDGRPRVYVAQRIIVEPGAELDQFLNYPANAADETFQSHAWRLFRASARQAGIFPPAGTSTEIPE